MKRMIGLLLLAITLTASQARAQPAHQNGGLGFHNVDAPIGVRWWLSDQKVAIDAGFGLGSEEDTGVDESLSHWAFDVGVPILLKSLDRAHFLVRPGILYRSQEVVVDAGPPVDTDNNTELAISVELEAEVFLADGFSVSAAHGLAFINRDPAVGESATDWGTIGSNFTNVGFHLYFFGSE